MFRLRGTRYVARPRDENGGRRPLCGRAICFVPAALHAICSARYVFGRFALKRDMRRGTPEPLRRAKVTEGRGRGRRRDGGRVRRGRRGGSYDAAGVVRGGYDFAVRRRTAKVMSRPTGGAFGEGAVVKNDGNTGKNGEAKKREKAGEKEGRRRSGGVFSLGDHPRDGGAERRRVLAVGDAVPLFGGLNDAHRERAVADRVVDHARQIQLVLQGVVHLR